MTQVCRSILLALFILANGAAAASTDTFDAAGVSSITAWLRNERVVPGKGYGIAVPDPLSPVGASGPATVGYDYDEHTRWVSINGPPAELTLKIGDDLVRLRCSVGVVVEVSQSDPAAIRPLSGARDCKKFEGGGFQPPPLAAGAPNTPMQSILEQMDRLSLQLFRSVVSLSHPPPQ